MVGPQTPQPLPCLWWLISDLYLDGVNLDYLNWQITGAATGAFATVSIEPGQHHLYTLGQGHGFAAYYHATCGTNSLSYGYAVSYGNVQRA